MRRRLFRVHGSYLFGIGMLVTVVFYLTSTSRVSRENVTAKNEVYEEMNDDTDSEPDFKKYIVSNRTKTGWLLIFVKEQQYCTKLVSVV